MTGSEMNAPIRKIAALSVLVAGTLGLTACAGAFDPETDATSPLAPRVQEMVDSHREFPRWEQFPRQLEPEPEPVAIAANVNTLRVSSGALAGEASRIDWQTSGDAAAFAESTRARVSAVEVARPTAETAAEIEAFARRARERGRAPPPIDRR
ncbi:hypothetical protein [Brevundimonas lenta]|uniref:Uncharacterized protein n=1 Tax=Brevundimonas lenta TaxID=424796 RepID=A0A7W6NQ69_9CAUL|nr:hypothetical protein [Brevundimonas lenta]MBB4082907.1 hypothetical protein [Brevundimonas lenta]